MSRRYYSVAYDYPEIRVVKYCVEGSTFSQVGLRALSLGTHEILAGESFEQAYQRVYTNVGIGSRLYETVLGPGEYYPRIARPIEDDQRNRPSCFPSRGLYTSEVAGTIGQLASLAGRLAAICQVVEPVPANLMVFGHEVRECLVIASMELESHWKAILRSNGTTGTSTKDYVKVLPAMKLDEYEIALSRYPRLTPLRPFAGWNSAQPTQSLPFYDAYNSVKHDRESAFSLGTLEQTFYAVAGCAVIAAAQFGSTEVLGKNTALREFFSLTATPNWSPSDMYYPAKTDWPARPVHYKF